jgi:hypothetical protein
MEESHAGRITTLVHKRSEFSCDRCYAEFTSLWHLRHVKTNDPMIEVRMIHEWIVFHENPDIPDKTEREIRRFWRKREMDVCGNCIKATDEVVFGMTREQRRKARIS